MPAHHEICRLCKIRGICKISVPRGEAVTTESTTLCKNFRCGMGVVKANRQLDKYRRGGIKPIKATIRDPTTGKTRDAMLLEVTSYKRKGGGIEKTGYVTLEGDSVVSISGELLLTGQKLF